MHLYRNRRHCGAAGCDKLCLALRLRAKQSRRVNRCDCWVLDAPNHGLIVELYALGIIGAIGHLKRLRYDGFDGVRRENYLGHVRYFLGVVSVLRYMIGDIIWYRVADVGHSRFFVVV